MNAFIEHAERVVQTGVQNIMTSQVALSAILVFLAVALLRAFQLEPKILLRGAIILFIANYAVLRLGQEYVQSGKGYRDFLFREPVAPLKSSLPTLHIGNNAASESESATQIQPLQAPVQQFTNRTARVSQNFVKAFQEDKTFEF